MRSVSVEYMMKVFSAMPSLSLFLYINDDGDVLAIRYDNWKIVFIHGREGRA